MCLMNNRGVVLISVLLIMQILLALGFFTLDSSNLAKRLVLNYAKTNKFHQEIKNKFIEIEKVSSISGSGCTIAQQNILSYDLKWWQEDACIISDDANIYYYVLEILNNTICKTTIHGAQPITYLRLTMLVNNKTNNMQELLQSTLATKSITWHNCATLKDLNLGRQSFRLIRITI